MITSSADANAVREPVIICAAHGHTALRKLSDAGEFSLASRMASAMAIIQQVEADLQLKQRELYQNQR